jgi:hypothetical protein
MENENFYNGKIEMRKDVDDCISIWSVVVSLFSTSIEYFLKVIVEIEREKKRERENMKQRYVVTVQVLLEANQKIIIII